MCAMDTYEFFIKLSLSVGNYTELKIVVFITKISIFNTISVYLPSNVPLIQHEGHWSCDKQPAQSQWTEVTELNNLLHIFKTMTKDETQGKYF
jgi:hypothetical protein